MLDKAYEAGVRAAKLAYVGEHYVNKGLGLAKDVAKQVTVGQAPEVFVEGPHTFAPGGTMHWRNVLWPKSTLGRAGSLLTLAALPSMMSQDKARGEGRLSGLLGGVGGLAGMMYGGTAGGMLGTPIGGPRPPCWRWSWTSTRQQEKGRLSVMKDAHKRGVEAALARFKLSNMQAGAAGYNPTLNGQATTNGMASAPSVSPPSMKPPTSPAAPLANGAAKSKVLG